MRRFAFFLLVPLFCGADATVDPRSFNALLHLGTKPELPHCEAQPRQPQTDIHTSLFCMSPYDAICGAENGDVTDEWVRREKASNERIAKSTATFLARVAQKAIQLGIWKGDPSKFTIYDFMGIQSKLDLNKQFEMLKVMQATTDSEEKQVKAVVERTLKKAINQLSSAVDAQVKGPLATKMKKSFETAQVITIDDAQKFFRNNPVRMLKFFERYYEGCGSDGMKNQAFLFPPDGPDGPAPVVLCPGFLLRASVDAEYGVSEESFVMSWMGTLTHELAHTIDYSARYAAFQSAYEKYTDCLMTTYPYNEEANRFRYDEIIADYWAVQSVAEYIRRQDSYGWPLSAIEALAILRRSYGWLCNGNGWDEWHPTHRYRTDFLLRQDPAINEIMKCNSMYPRQTCTLKGVAPL